MTQVGSYCTQCGAKLEPSSKFCYNCGRPLPLVPPPETSAIIPNPHPTTGLTIIRVLYSLAGVGWFSLAIFAAVGSNATPSLDDNNTGAVVTLVSISIGILHFVLVYGLSKAKSWAWIGTALLSIAGIVLSVIVIAYFSIFGTITTVYSLDVINGIILALINIIINLLILYYLYWPEVKAYFGDTVNG